MNARTLRNRLVLGAGITVIGASWIGAEVVTAAMTAGCRATLPRGRRRARPRRFSAPGSPIGPKFTSLRTAGAGVLPGSVLNSIFPAVLTVDRPRDIAQARRLFWRQESRSLRPVAANKKAQLVGSPDRSASADITSEARLTSSRSVLAKSSPIHKSGSPAREAIAYVQQSPKFKAAGCLPLPNRE